MLALVVLALHILGGFAAPSQLVLNSLIQDVGIKVGLSSESTKVAKPLTGNIVYELHETERKFLLNVPDNYVHGETHPLVFSFHAGGYSEKQQCITELSDPNLKIAGKPFLTAYAQGVNNTDWNMTHIWKGAPYENTTVDDIAYVYDILHIVSSSYTIDKSRLYACGKSNGGGFTALLACRPDTSALFAAFAPVSPALYQGTYSFHGCQTERGVNIFHSHGVEDTDTQYHGRTPEGGSFGPEPDVRRWRREWAERNGCKSSWPGQWAEPEVEEIYPGVWEEVWDCPKGEVRGLSIEGLGHAWPSTAGWDLAGFPNQTASFNFTSPHLVDFFSKHRLV
ncbi:poly(3-hydroxybutyrate) depolymerase [Cryptococcus deuterogattii 99/473]|uniref:feruloyl esterase n=1 Tax=Cryptococcus deuterogattii Ram5 TaxID=1296110 RepID=A0A0D0V5J3_9TREE|nr:poly(3-hydroxybutyrate) depolymerase [Cryptococcus deuterogattii LA55]KIR35352.1 poly(3-hydroxybutyrate) depolymerase [Cryptococcus deuterogattii MMRL2647]KIR40235.1 poly(3-hydroxybutyrate) depolymerase [Cryptococcus deuterogattii Ram5]KIR71949.1 poly(3-hydroxybutyrate) depolymerase [Cryptococcus deuterogattii CA1014]KIR93511.1 poly(3-hydroxybutyrate) depolymerase [Cryptococcus deuterogattii CBS 10090]KIY54739.1 poly(3-hydroxybutyrate) depolymerase [Cryptococcus deuterogattii 99/473]